MITLMINVFYDYSQEYIGVLMLSVLASFSVIGIISYFEFIFEKDISPKKIESPEDKYLRISQENFNKAINKIDYDIEDKKKPNEFSYVIQYTPIGIVIMSYDNNEKLFIYYTDKTSVNYNILNAVCQNYCSKTHNFAIYTSLSVIEKDLERKNKRYKSDPNFKKIVTKKMNTFIRKGNIRDFSFLKKDYDNIKTQNNISFTDFKNRIKNNNL